jgi:outer membrane protein assembly factor BamE (lipoprotein component of BamABCDE complex)
MNNYYHRTAGFGLLFFALIYSIAPVPAMAQSDLGTGAFPKTELIESQLKRGMSKKGDVQQVLGIPNGAGGALLPGYGEKSTVLEPYQIWYYEDIETTDVKSGGFGMNITLRQQILAVYFKGEIFHGYFWTSNSDTAKIR